MFPQPLQLLAACVPFTPFAHALRMFIHEPLQLEQLHGPLLQLGQQALVFTVLIAAGRVVRRTIPALRRRFA
jgi:hypothetical protein